MNAEAESVEGSETEENHVEGRREGASDERPRKSGNMRMVKLQFNRDAWQSFSQYQ